MAIVANTFTAYDAIGVREDLSDVIENISPTKTPFMSGIQKGKVTNTFCEWQTDALAAAANNKKEQGYDVAATGHTAVTPTVRVSNRCQLSIKDFIISGTEEATNKAGRKSEIAYQIAKKGEEIKRDMEFALTQNTTAIAASAGTAGQTRGLEGWIETNDSLGAGGASPSVSGNTAPTDGTQRALTESLLKTVLQNVFTQGGDPDTVMVGPFNKQVFSTFNGNATRFDKAESGTVNAYIDVYKSDFGTLKVVPNRFQRERTAFVLEMGKFELCYLRPFQTAELAKTGDAEKRMLLVEYGLKCHQEAASGAVRDLTTS